MDYKKQAEWLLIDAEDYSDQGYITGDLKNAAKSIMDLLNRAESAEAMIEKLKSERDAAISDLRKFVPTWKWDGADKNQPQKEISPSGYVDFG